MLCLTDIIRDQEPSLQPLLRAVDEAPTLTAMLVAVWPLARVLALQVVTAVLTERAGRVKALSSAMTPVSLGGSGGGAGSAGAPGGVRSPPSPPWMPSWTSPRISAVAGNSRPSGVPWRCLSPLPRRRRYWGGTAGTR
jgi:hypothetical protein